MEELLQGRTFTCPQCRKKHHAVNGIQSFPQNKYIISLLRKTANSRKEEKFDTCEDHNREMSLYCNGLECQMAVCSLCMIKEHKDHEIKDLQEINKEKRETIVNGVTSLKSDLEVKKESFIITKQELDNMTDACITKIRQKKEEYMRIFDELMHGAIEHSREVKKKIEKGIGNIDDNMLLLDNVMENIRHATYSGLVRNHEEFKEIIEKSFLQISEVGISKYPGYSESTASNACGNVTLLTFDSSQLESGGTILNFVKYACISLNNITSRHTAPRPVNMFKTK